MSTLFFSCKKEENTAPQNTSYDYAFLVAGHIYGKPQGESIGFHPPFKDYFPQIKNTKRMEYAFYTGDIVRHNSVLEEWEATYADMLDLGLDYHVAAGNHDRGSTFLDYFGSYYYSFMHGSNLFIILNTLHWVIEDEQKAFLEETLADIDDVSNIFLFSHEVIWWGPDSIFQNIEVNNTGSFSGNSNYWEEISPVLVATEKPVYYFSGDVGATSVASPYAYHHYDNVHLVASGMGHGTDDNFLIVEVYPNGSVYINLIALQGEPDRFGDIREYELP